MTDRRVHIVDDDGSVRLSTAVLLRTQGYTVESYASGLQFLAAAADARRGCVLLDVRMPGLDGLEVLARLGQQAFAMPVVVMTAHGDIATAVSAMRAGALNFIEKPFEFAALRAALDEAFARLDQRGDEALTAARAAVRLTRLTARERDVLEGLVGGMTNKLIAIKLGISPRTVEIHRANLMEKLDVRTLSEALRIAIIAGLGGL